MLSCRPPTYNTKTKLDMSVNFKPILLDINKLSVVHFALRQEYGNVIIYTPSNLFIPQKFKISLYFLST